MKTLPELRKEIDQINTQLVELLGKRLEIAREIAKIKKQSTLPILDSNREESIKKEIRKLAKEHRFSPFIMEEIFQILLDYTKMEMEGQ